MTTPDLTLPPSTIIDEKGTVVSITSTHAVVRSSARSSHRRTMLVRLRGAVTSMRERFGEMKAAARAANAQSDWSVGDFEELHGQSQRALPPADQRFPAPGPESPLGASGAHKVQVPSQRGPQQAQSSPSAHPPFAHQPATHTHVAIRMQRILVEASWDAELTPSKLWASMGPLFEELRGLAEQEQAQPRRMERNLGDVVAQAALLEDAARRGRGDEAVAQAQDGIVGRAVHVGNPLATGVMPVITDDMLDPRTAALPVDVVDEPVLSESPLHAVDTGTLPAVPSDDESAPHVTAIVPDRPWSDAEETHVSPAVADESEGDDVRTAVSQ